MQEIINYLKMEILYLMIHSNDRSINWLIDWLIDWMTGRLIDWLIGWITNWLIDLLIDWFLLFFLSLYTNLFRFLGYLFIYLFIYLLTYLTMHSTHIYLQLHGMRFLLINIPGWGSILHTAAHQAGTDPWELPHKTSSSPSWLNSQWEIRP